ncbi:MAG: hypothetical protein V4721_00440 [Bacteroidota bacterium]
MCGPSKNRKQEAAVKEQDAILENQRKQAEAQLAETRRVEEERSGKIRSNVSSIDQAFSQFDDSYYNKAGQNLRDYYNPQLQDQFEKAQRKVTLDLADRDLLDSSVAGKKAGELKELFDREQQGIESRAQDASNSVRSDVSARSSNLKRLAEAGTSLDSFSNMITPEISQINLPTNYGDLGSVFGSLTNDISTLQKSGVIPTYDGSGSGAKTTNSARIIK